jgi:hypothetical protein
MGTSQSKNDLFEMSGCLGQMVKIKYSTCSNKINIIMTKKILDPNFTIYKKFYQFRRGCIDPTYPSWNTYGRLGIKMYKPWLADKFGYYRFLEYVHDTLGPCPGVGYYLTRKNSLKNFTPGNICWKTIEVMNNSRRDNCYVTHNGIKLSIAQWCRQQGLTQSCVNIRTGKLGWTLKEALELI